MTIDPTEITLGMQIAEVRREIDMRESVYKRRVADKKMRQRDADLQIASMRAVLRTLESLRG